jgi:hypothetical protein
MLLFALFLLIPSIAWYSYVFISSGSNVVELFIDYQLRLFSTSDGGHGGTVLYHPFVLLVGCFPHQYSFAGIPFKVDDNERNRTLNNGYYFFYWYVVIVFSLLERKSFTFHRWRIFL